MRPLTIQEVRQAVAGRALCALPAGDLPLIKSVSTDTRTLEPGALFVALKGDRHDGHHKLSEAAAKGAVAALVEQPIGFDQPNLHLFTVSSTRIALGKLATLVRGKLQSKVIAVAGSNGKTSTKYLIHAVLETKLRGSISPKSFNNDIGVPLAIFPADPLANYLVLEIGTNHHGEVKALSELALPDIAVITSIGEEHLEGLGNLDGVRREEASIIAGMNKTGTLIVNGDDPKLLRLIAKSFPGEVFTFGLSDRNQLFATDIHCDATGVHFNLNGSPHRRVFLPMLGKHQASNALAAIAVARKLGLDENDIINALAHAQGPEMRLQVQKIRGMTLLNDAYNANPASMRAAIETVCALPASRGGRRVAVVGDMRELGDQTERAHRETGQFLAERKLDVLICVGKNACLVAQEARRSGMPRNSVRTFTTATAAARVVPSLIQRGDLVLFKASRVMELETVVQAIANQKSPQRRLAS